MIEFITQYWRFFVAGLILIALIAYWIFDVVRTKKAKERQLDEMEAKLRQEEALNQESENNEPKAKEPKEITKEETAEEKPEEKPEETVEEKPAKEEEKKAGIYMISYDKEKKDWVVKRRGSKRATKRTKTKKEALDLVKSLTESQDVGYVVKKKDGKFQKK